MKVKGIEIPEAVQNAVVDLMKRRHTFTAFALATEIASHMACGPLDEVAYRGADRIVQRERKAGNIRPSDSTRSRSPYWKWVGQQ
ncbi:hypothetical protein GCT13_13375 [Paraburkholderia sp. CNPSo 3157]|uniref:Transposase n=1 Tax=Paraburkholderia franconis TaxID=2654983 RepID=A0A7X1NAB9_9BURK|nr:hypothetical protein [Paraburkholderia franconis]MPW17901.1 hypothetical protein [Paraburkholderia franconis]